MNGKLNKFLFINSFVIKIIALLTMTIDHIGVVISLYSNSAIVDVFRSIGRLALPLFCLCIVEGVIHTKNFGKYMLRLGIMGTIVTVAYILIYSLQYASPQMIASIGNIYVDLILGAVSVYLLSRKEWYLKIGCILPIAVSFISCFAGSYEISTNGIVWWFPFCIRTQYGFYAVLLCVSFYLSYLFADVATKSYADKYNLDRDAVLPAGSVRLVSNITCILMLCLLTFILWITSTNYPIAYLNQQPFAILSGALLLFYSGKQGYNSKCFKWIEYLYYPVHIGIIGIILLIGGML